MFEHGDPILKRHSEQMREIYAKYSDRNWKTGYTPEQIARIERWRQEKVRSKEEKTKLA